MSWTSTTPVGCTSCHGSPPSSGRHSTHSGISCYNCHNAVVDASNGIVGASLHVNGAEDVRFGGTRSGGSPVSGTWNPSTRSCSVSCHGSETW